MIEPWKGEPIPAQPGLPQPNWAPYKPTPAKGPIEYPSPPAQTQVEVQASWHKAKNIRPVIKKVKS